MTSSYRVLYFLFLVPYLTSCSAATFHGYDSGSSFRVNFSTMSQFGSSDQLTVLSSGELFFAKPEQQNIEDDYSIASVVSLAKLITAVSDIPEEIPNNVQVKVLSACQDGDYLRVIIQDEDESVFVLIIPMSESCFPNPKIDNWIEIFLSLYNTFSRQLQSTKGVQN